MPGMQVLRAPATYRCFLPYPEIDCPDQRSGIVNLGLQNDVTIAFVKFPMRHFLHLVGQEIFNLPYRQAGYLASILVEKFRIVQRWLFQSFVPSFRSAKNKNKNEASLIVVEPTGTRRVPRANIILANTLQRILL